MLKNESVRTSSSLCSKSPHRASRQPRVIQVNRDVATMVDVERCANSTPTKDMSSTDDWEICESSNVPFRQRTLSDGFLRNTSQELLLGIDCQACRSMRKVRLESGELWLVQPQPNKKYVSEQNVDLVCNCDLKKYYYDRSHSVSEQLGSDRSIFDIERIKADTGRTSMAVGSHRSLDRKQAKGKSSTLASFLPRQLTYEPAASIVEKIKRNLTSLKKIGGETILKKHNYGVQLKNMSVDRGDGRKHLDKNNIGSFAREYGAKCSFERGNLASTYTNFSANVDENHLDRNASAGKLVRMRSLDTSVPVLANDYDGVSSKFSTLDGRGNKGRFMGRQLSQNEFWADGVSTEYSASNDAAAYAAYDYDGKRPTTTAAQRSADCRPPSAASLFKRDYLSDREMIMLESNDDIAAFRGCTCASGAVFIDAKMYDIHSEKMMQTPPAPAPDVTARVPAPRTCSACRAARTCRATRLPWPPTAGSHTSSTTATSSSRGTNGPSRRWCCVAALVLVAGTACVAGPLALRAPVGAPLAERVQLARQLLHDTPLVDGHNDLPWNIRKFLHNRIADFKFDEDLRSIPPWANSAWSHTDLPRLKKGRVTAQFWAAYVPCESQHRDAVQLTFEQIDLIRRLTDKYHPQMTLCTSAEDILAAHSSGRVCSLIGVEGGHSLGGSLAVLRTLQRVGARYLTLTSTCDTPWAESAPATAVTTENAARPNAGLSPFGKTIIKEMNRLGMLVDLSHVSARTMRDALAVSRAPVIFSHSAARALCNTTRNVPDNVLKRLPANRGLVMISFYASFLSCKTTATVRDAIAHINHIREVAGVDHVGLGAGFDGINYTPEGLDDVSSYPLLFAELMGAGWSTDDLKKLAGLNFLRVMEAADKIRQEMADANQEPFEDTIFPKIPDPYNCSSQKVI